MGTDPIYLNDLEQRGLLVKKEVWPRHSLLSRHQWMGGGINGVNKRGLTPIYLTPFNLNLFIQQLNNIHNTCKATLKLIPSP
jgi:hypothetical protein